jgi:hypothetical protein
MAKSVSAYVGCIAGAVPIADYENGLRDAGFAAVQVIDTNKDLNAYALVEGQSGCCSPAMESESASGCCEPEMVSLGVHAGLADLSARYDINAYAASVQVYAVKPTSV